ncbi:hypothetical protein AB0L85_22415 [Streptomyces sp. NPDC052051]|uniref:Secreted protein n=1 Tax=Streptomyces macrolidinus TaxID=2952607 RepID=A0ABT0ZAI3_9ACTN|nr:hypothetical protein [Streptomyces macrolidinus]MCN9240432.1 hypothetical protein [Streptomyces macrolidinus]
MTTRRGWTAAGRWAAATAAALALVGAASATATADPAHEHEPTYRCVLLETHELPFAVGRFCEAHHGAPHEGPIFGHFRIESPRGAVRCEVFRPFSGFAQLPERVEGRFCHHIVR